MLAANDARAGPATEEPRPRPPEPDRRPDPFGKPPAGDSDRDGRLSFWDALMRALASIHT